MLMCIYLLFCYVHLISFRYTYLFLVIPRYCLYLINITEGLIQYNVRIFLTYVHLLMYQDANVYLFIPFLIKFRAFCRYEDKDHILVTVCYEDD